jgi:two-component system, NtrC family, sensor kinase
MLDMTTPRSEGPRERVLVVDDSRIVRTIFSKYLSPKFECVEAGSFDEAIAQMRKDDFAVVITDIIMPGLSGIELMRKIFEDFPETAVIIVSGVDRPQRALDAIRLGAFDYIIKPCEPEVLELTVERALERRDLLINARRYKIDLETRNIELVKRKEQLERLQAQIVQSEKMASLGQLASGVAHELNNPVGFVYANLEMLDQFVSGLIKLTAHYDAEPQSEGSAAEAASIKNEIGYPAIIDEIKSILRDCRDGSERIREIVKNLRTFSRLDEAEFKDSDIHEGIESTLRLISQYFSAGSITLTRDFGDLPLIGTFSGQLNQVWMNLLVNAAQAIGKNKGEVKIRTHVEDGYIVVEVTDSGIGIAIQDTKRIFDPFYTTKPVGEGTGLGLSISYGIVERHGGTISVNSRLNESTTFTVRLPVDFEPTAEFCEKSIVFYDQERTELYDLQDTYC